MKTGFTEKFNPPISKTLGSVTFLTDRFEEEDRGVKCYRVVGEISEEDERKLAVEKGAALNKMKDGVWICF